MGKAKDQSFVENPVAEPRDSVKPDSESEYNSTSKAYGVLGVPGVGRTRSDEIQVEVEVTTGKEQSRPGSTF